MSSTALDTSVIVAALLPWHGDHEASRRAIAHCRDRGDRLLLPLPVLAQSYSVLTRLPPGRRLRLVVVLELLKKDLGARVDLVGTAPPDGWRLLEGAVAAGVSGGGIHDFEILACAAASGADRLLTLDSDDFLRFGDRGVEIASP